MKTTLMLTINYFLCTEWVLVKARIKSLYFSSGYASNVSRFVSLEHYKLYRIKSHDYHVFMQTLIQLAYHNLFSNMIKDASIIHRDQPFL